MNIFLNKEGNWQIAIIACTLFMLSCGNTPRKGTSQQQSRQIYQTAIPAQTTPNRNAAKAGGLVPNISLPESYEEGYIDGEAAAEEDRLAGHPGMQVGADDDEEDYEDGYDDGYEE